MIDTAFLFDHGDDSPLVIVVLYGERLPSYCRWIIPGTERDKMLSIEVALKVRHPLASSTAVITFFSIHERETIFRSREDLDHVFLAAAREIGSEARISSQSDFKSAAIISIRPAPSSSLCLR